jgi:hypothetical protein
VRRGDDVAKKATAKKKRTPKAAKKKPARKVKAKAAKNGAAPAKDTGWGEQRVPMLLAEHHVRVLQELGRQYGCVGPKGEVVLERVLRELLDRYGSVLLTVAQPKRAVDEEE